MAYGKTIILYKIIITCMTVNHFYEGWRVQVEESMHIRKNYYNTIYYIIFFSPTRNTGEHVKRTLLY